MYRYKKLDAIPSAPFVHVTVSPAIPEGSSEELEFLVDSGAFITCLSPRALEMIGSEPRGRVKIETATGKERLVPAHWVSVTFGGRTFTNIKVAEMATSLCLLGRDIINNFRLELNGPEEYLEILPPKEAQDV
jgi:predicted aspartyl protease